MLHESVEQMKERRDEPSGGWGLVSINNDEIERHNATVCKNRVIVVSANVKYESQLGNAFTTVDSRACPGGGGGDGGGRRPLFEMLTYNF